MSAIFSLHDSLIGLLQEGNAHLQSVLCDKFNKAMPGFLQCFQVCYPMTSYLPPNDSVIHRDGIWHFLFYRMVKYSSVWHT